VVRQKSSRKARNAPGNEKKYANKTAHKNPPEPPRNHYKATCGGVQATAGIAIVMRWNTFDWDTFATLITFT
jgi:hypothetical protein